MFRLAFLALWTVLFIHGLLHANNKAVYLLLVLLGAAIGNLAHALVTFLAPAFIRGRAPSKRIPPNPKAKG